MILFFINYEALTLVSPYAFVCCPRQVFLSLFSLVPQGDILQSRVESPHQLRVLLPQWALLYEILRSNPRRESLACIDGDVFFPFGHACNCRCWFDSFVARVDGGAYLVADKAFGKLQVWRVSGWDEFDICHKSFNLIKTSISSLSRLLHSKIRLKASSRRQHRLLPSSRHRPRRGPGSIQIRSQLRMLSRILPCTFHYVDGQASVLGWGEAWQVRALCLKSRHFGIFVLVSC